MINIILLDDQAFIRNAIKLLLNKEEDFRVSGEASSISQVIELVETNLEVDIMIAEADMSGMVPIEFLNHLAALSTKLKVIFLSMVDSEKNIMEAINAGAKGYLNKAIEVSELLFAIRHVYNDGQYICSNSSMLLLNKLNSVPVITPIAFDDNMEFPAREIEILVLMAGGFTNYEIAEKLFTSKRTVEGHRQNLLNKTGSRNTASLIKFAMQYGMIKS